MSPNHTRQAPLGGVSKTARSSDELSKPPDGMEVSGSFVPAGPPSELPAKIDVGTGCLVELSQSYSIPGDLSGSMKIDYRIPVYGPCGSSSATVGRQGVGTRSS